MRQEHRMIERPDYNPSPEYLREAFLQRTIFLLVTSAAAPPFVVLTNDRYVWRDHSTLEAFSPWDITVHAFEAPDEIEDDDAEDALTRSFDVYVSLEEWLITLGLEKAADQ